MTSREQAGEGGDSSSEHVERFPAEAARHRVRAGDVLAQKYLVERTSGRLAGCTLLTVRHAEFGQRFTLMYLPVHPCLRADQSERLLEAARRALALKGQHVARWFDAGKLPDGGAFAVTELLESANLQALISMRGALAVADAAGYALQAAEAVAEAHANGFVHGTLGPASVFLTKGTDGSPRVQVTGFGLHECMRSDPLRAALLLSDRDGCFDAGATFEPIEWLSPEQVRLVPDLDARTDVWGLGVLLYVALTGRSPHPAPSVTLLLATILGDAPLPITVIRPDVPPELDAVVLRCLAKDRSARFRTLGDVAAALEPFASKEGASCAARIARMLAMAQSAADANRALVQVAAAPESAAPVLVTPSARLQVIWTTALVAFALVGGALAGAIGARSPARVLPPGPVAAHVHAAASPSLRIEAAKPTDQSHAHSVPAVGDSPEPSASASPPQNPSPSPAVEAQHRPRREGARARTSSVVHDVPVARSRSVRAEVTPEAAAAPADLFDRMR